MQHIQSTAMASLYLPAPTRSGNKVGPAPSGSSSAIVSSSEAPITQNSVNGKGSQKRRVPSYDDRVNSAIRFSKLTPEERKQPQNKQLLFVPRSAADFDDGGSFPEIHVAQYPRHMGNPHLAKRNNASSSVVGGEASNNNSSAPSGRAIVTRDVLSAQVDATGKVSYDAIVTGGTNSDKKVYSKHSDLRGCRPTGEEIALPTQEEETSTAERTQRALAALISTKVAMDKPTGSAITAATDSATAHERTQFIRYTPNENAPGYNPQASQRIIRMVPKQIDPMQPPKHMHRKAPRGPAEDPVPVLHAPPEKLSKEEREAWNVPACISNWKNTRGYTIPLDKRLAADGRGLRDDATINPNFAVLSESLYVAERQAREEVRTRAAVQKRLVLDQRQRREDELRELANKARMERSQMGSNANSGAPAAAGSGDIISGQGGGSYHDADENDDDSVESMTQRNESSSSPPASKVSNVEEEQARVQRDRLRAERRREREKEYRLERAGKSVEDDNTEEELKKKRRLENDRDVSEKIALGTHTGSGGAGGVDSRLYSQNAGLDSGFGAEDEYNTYSRPMFDREGVTSSSIYRPTRDANMEDADAQYDKLRRGATSKFAPDKGFGGADNGGATAGGASRSAPVQFEKGK
jgi:SNW domain-containing protein 1